MEKLSNKELMIGNYVRGFWYNYDDDEKEMSDILEVNCIDDVGVTDYAIWASGTNVSAEMYHKLEPIELTPEILIRLGFESIQEFYTWFYESSHRNGFDIEFLQNKGYEKLLQLKLHQLQNLVSVLTGKQITLKEEK